MLSSLRMPCPSCRPSSQIGTLNTMTCLLLMPHFVEAMQSPCNGFHPTATYLTTSLLTVWQRKAQQRSKWIGPPATLRWRPPSSPSNTASGGMSTHCTTRLSPATCQPDENKCYLSTRREQVTVFRFRTGYNRLNYHLYSKLCTSHTEQCPCGTSNQTTERPLMSCPIYEPLRKESGQTTLS